MNIEEIEKAKIKLLEKLQYKKGLEISYNQTSENYILFSQQLENINKNFSINPDIKETRKNVVTFLVNTYLYKTLTQRGAEIKTFEDLRKLAKYYELTQHYNEPGIEIAIKLNQEANTLIQIEESLVFTIRTGLKGFIDEDIISSYNTNLDNFGTPVAKSQTEYQNNWKLALSEIEKYRISLGEELYNHTVDAINMLFSYYTKGIRKVNLNPENEKKI